jgi:hypothetical protein
MFQIKRIWIVVLILCVVPTGLLAQTDSNDACPVIVKTALEAVATACSGVERNTACYGNVFIQAEAQPGVTDLRFDAIGDTVNLIDIQSLTLNGLDVATDQWGVALLLVQANIPDTLPGQNVTILLFGDVQISQATGSPSPMQAFYFQSGIGQTPCIEAPESGMLIQTPEGVTEISMNINGVDLQIGSTAYIQAFPPDEEEDTEGQMMISLLEGEATISANDSQVTIPAGQFSTIALDEELQVAGAPADPMPYDTSAFEALPLSLLEREIEVVQGDGMQDDGEQAAASDIQPLSGTWLYTTQELQFSEGCPAELIAYMPQVMPQVSETDIINWEGGFTIENYLQQIEQSGEPLPASASITSPEQGVILIEYAEEGASVIIETRAISERLIETTMTMSITEGMSCTIIIPGTVEYQD